MLLLIPVWQGDPLNSTYWLVGLLGLPLAALFGISIHFMYPTVVVNKNGFKLQTPLYESVWYDWDQLSRIRPPAADQWVTQLYVIGCKDFDIWFTVIGYTQGVFAPAFLIHPNMRNGERLLRLLLKQRPDLFPPSRLDWKK